VVLSNGTVFSSKSGSIKERTQNEHRNGHLSLVTAHYGACCDI